MLEMPQLQDPQKPFRQKFVPPNKADLGGMPTTWREYFIFLNSLQIVFPEPKPFKKPTKALPKPSPKK